MRKPGPGVGVASERGDRTTAADAETADVALAASGDGRAFERLYRGHVARIHSLACRMIGLELADDVTQEVFVRAWRKLGTFRGEAAFGTWLYRLAVNLILAQRQSRGGERVWYDAGAILETTPSAAREPELALDFEDAISRLPSGARQVFVLHDVAGYKHEEIGALLGIAPGTSKSQLHRARMALRGYLDR